MRSGNVQGLIVLLSLLALPGFSGVVAQESGNHAVYLRVADRMEMPVAEVGQKIEGVYFEDAGKMKFARNMRMPGSIEDEIRTLVRGVLNQ